MYHNSMAKDMEKIKKNTKKAVIAATTSASLVVGSTYESAKEIVNPAIGKEPHVEDLIINPDNVAKPQQLTFKQRFKKWFSALPLLVRIVVGLPLYFIGFAILALCQVLFQKVFLGNILYLIVGGIVIFLLHLLTRKLITPGKKLKELVNKETIGFSLLTIALIGVAALLLPKLWNGADSYMQHITSATISITLAASAVQYISTVKKEETDTYLIVSDDNMTITSMD